MLRRIHGVVAASIVALATSVVGVGAPASTTGAQAKPHAGPSRAAWSDRAAMPAARAEVGVAALNGRVYVVGGTVQHGDQEPTWTTTLVTSYDPRADRWSRHAPLPRPLTHVAVAASNGKLYAFGGFTDIVHMHPQQVAYVYDPPRDTWSRLPDMPLKLGSVGVAAVNGKLHLVGGRDSRTIVTLPDPPISLGYGTVRTHLMYDPARRTWSTADPLPVEPRDHAGVAVLGDRLHVFGGRVADGEESLARHDVYDTRTRRWTTAAPLPAPRSAGAAVVLDGRIVYAGGECRPDGTTYDDVTVYDAGKDRWSTLAPLPQGRHGFGAGRVGDHAYFVAGAPTCGGGASADTFKLTLR